MTVCAGCGEPFETSPAVDRCPTCLAEFHGSRKLTSDELTTLADKLLDSKAKREIRAAKGT